MIIPLTLLQRIEAYQHALAAVKEDYHTMVCTSLHRWLVLQELAPRESYSTSVIRATFPEFTAKENTRTTDWDVSEWWDISLFGQLERINSLSNCIAELLTQI